MAITINPSGMKKNLVKDVLVSLGEYPASLNTVALRLMMLIDLSKKIGNEECFKVIVPTKNYIAVYGAKNGNNSGAYLSIKKAVKDLEEINFFKSIVYTNKDGRRTTYIQIELNQKQFIQLSSFLEIANKSRLSNFSKLRSNHAVRFYIFLNYVLKSTKPLNMGKATVNFNAQEMRKIFGISDQDYKQVGNFWSLIFRLCDQITQYSNIQIYQSQFSGQTSHKEFFLTIGFKQLRVDL